MSLPLPNLDDRSFAQLMEEARREIQRNAPEWSDLSAGDPGTVLLETFAHLTETMIYRLNRLPKKVYVAFLRLLGVTLHPPAAAQVVLRFSRGRAGDDDVEIPRGTRVTTSRGSGSDEAPIFVTAVSAMLPAGETAVDVLALHCDLVEGELLGIGTGLPSLSLTVQQPPIIAPTGDDLDLVLGVETDPEKLGEQETAVQFQGKAFRIWRREDNFTNLGANRFAYLADRLSGTITFAPAARMTAQNGELAEMPSVLAAIPEAGKEIRAWYRRGGGPAGNVAANTLATLKDPIAGLQVNNPKPASGGQAAEVLENALVRGPQELHALQRAVTARDFELTALDRARGAVARARALTRSAMWAHAVPGTVELLLVPSLPEDERGVGVVSGVTAVKLRSYEADNMRQQIWQVMDERRPLGTQCVVNWTNYKSVRVVARVVVGRQENKTAVRQRVLDRLHQTISPLPSAYSSEGWRFGQALRVSDVYKIVQAEPGVRWVDGVRFLVEEVPEANVRTIAADNFQESTWFAGSGSVLFRSLNDGAGWEPAGRFGDQQTINLVEPHPTQAGHVAVLTRQSDGRSQVYASQDCGETWTMPAQFAFGVEDLAWVMRGTTSILLLATDQGLYELALRPGSAPVQLVVNPNDQDRGFYAIASVVEARGVVTVAAAAKGRGGVYLSSDGGQSRSFRRIGLVGEDVRRLMIQRAVARAYLWAGAAASGDDPGKGCFRWELVGRDDPSDGWQAYNQGWKGGSCRQIAFLSNRVLVATHRAGVLWLEGNQKQWQSPELDSGLPLRGEQRLFHPVVSLATNPSGNLTMAGGGDGIYRSQDGGNRYRSASRKAFDEIVTLPQTWLFVSGEHEITVVDENEAS